MSGQRLVLSTVGIKSPLDVGEATDLADETPAREEPKAPQPRSVRSPERRSLDVVKAAQPASDPPPRTAREAHPASLGPRRRRAASTAPSRVAAGTVPAPVFYGCGRPLQTSIALNGACASRLEELARAAGVSVNALAVAALHAGLPATPDDVRSEIVDERVRRAGARLARVERNLRLPEQLRTRVDELTAAARNRLPRATRADLINAALERGLPAAADQAADLVAEHAKRLERAAGT